MSDEIHDVKGAQKGSLRATLRRQLGVYRAVLEIAWRSARVRFIARWCLGAFTAIGTTANGLIVKEIVDALAGGESRRALGYAVALLSLFALVMLAQDVIELIGTDLADRVMHEVDQRLMRIAAGAPGLDHLENSDFADRMKQIRERQWLPAQILTNMNALLYSAIGLASAVFLLGSIHPLFVLLPALALPSAWLQFSSHRKWWGEIDEVAPDQRLADHYLKLATEPQGAKELRLFGLRHHIIEEHRAVSERFLRRMLHVRFKQQRGAMLGGALYAVGLTGAVAFAGWLALRGRATPGEVALAVQVARQTIGHIEMAAGMTANLAEIAFLGDKYLWLLRYRPALVVREEPQQAPRVIRRGVTLEGVRFSYPGTEKVVLDGVDLHLPAGATVALVGENGAGKSTVVKLLARFYDPTEGRIAVDGVDLRDLDLEGWRGRIASSFQDFVRFNFVAREAVGVGDLSRIEDLERVTAATRFAGADRIVEKLPAGLDTQLGRQFTDGFDLSEGEWQRVALARGSMRETPALVVLDEPTASLDARAEHQVFERFAEMARPLDGAKPLTVLVSHRFSTVRMAELIVVMHEGRIEEIGSHDELMRSGGRYAELFRLQASRYD